MATIPLSQPEAHTGPEFSPPNQQEQAEAREVTVIIHGNGAATDEWWRPGVNGADTFADRLERALASRSKPNTVWTPALARGLPCEAFAWSGRNRHRDRVLAGRKVGNSLMLLARKLHATAARPLRVNLIAHSHGGNVAMQALRHLGPEVSVGSVVLMGTPLATAQPAVRLARFVLAPPLLTIILLWAMWLPVQFAWTIARFASGGVSWVDLTELLVLCVVPLVYGVTLKFACSLLDVAWRLTVRVRSLLRHHQRHEPFRLYGPSNRRMAGVLGRASILHLSTDNDEADLLLQSLAAPTDVYREAVKHLSAPMRLVERAFRSIDLFLPLAECVCEMYALGVPWWRAFFFDHKVGPPAASGYYPASFYSHETVTIPDVRMTPSFLPEPERPAGGSANTITQRMITLFQEISSQVSLWHYAYHESDFVLNRVADQIAGKPAPDVRRMTAGSAQI